MSRIGKKSITIPSGVEVSLKDQEIKVKGPKGELERTIRPEIKVLVENNEIKVFPCKETKKTMAFWGLTRALLNNMVVGVSQGFEKKLQIEGVGYKALMDGQDLVLSLGFSHPVKVKAPQGVTFSVEKNIVTLSGIDIEKVTQTAASIRKVKPPEPYKGKGIRYFGEIIKKKVGKKAVGSGK
jgi:large subunit ribosomal protein L6